jgi:hypothetical protein
MKCLGEYCANGSVTGLADVIMEAPLLIVIIARSEATKQSNAVFSEAWIASPSLSSGAHSRDPLARNDGFKIAQHVR